MGQAQSSNYTKMVSETYLKASQNTSQNSVVNSTASAIIAVSNTKGDVNISGVNSNQKVEAKAKAVFQAMNDSSIVQQISSELAQKSLAFLSGLPLGSSDAKNTINAYSNSAIAVNQDISTTCSTSASALFAINVSDTSGNVNIKDITIGQDVSSFQDCMASAVNKLVTQQSIKTVVDQSATAKVVGLDLGAWMLLLLPFMLLIGGIVIFVIVVSRLKIDDSMKMVIAIALLVIIISLCSYMLSTIPLSLTRANKELVDVDKQLQDLNDAPYKSPDEITTVWGSPGIINLPCTRSTARPATARPQTGLVGGSDGCYYALYDKTPSFTNIDSMTEWFAKSGNDVAAMDIIFKNNQPYCTVYRQLQTPELCRVALQACASMITTPLYCNVRSTVAESNLSTVSTGSNQFVFTTNGKLFRRNGADTAWVLVKDSIWNGTTNPTSVIVRTDPISPSDTPATLIVSGPIASGPYYYIDASVPANNILSGMNVYQWVKKQGSSTFDTSNGDWTLLTTIDMTALTNEQVVPFRTNPAFTDKLTTQNKTFIYIPSDTTKAARALQLSKLQSDRDTATRKISTLKVFRGFYITTIVLCSVGAISLLYKWFKGKNKVGPDLTNNPATPSAPEATTVVVEPSAPPAPDATTVVVGPSASNPMFVQPQLTNVQGKGTTL